MNKFLETIIVCFLAFVIGMIAGSCIAFEIIQKKFYEKSLKISKEINKIA